MAAACRGDFQIYVRSCVSLMEASHNTHRPLLRITITMTTRTTEVITRQRSTPPCGTCAHHVVPWSEAIPRMDPRTPRWQLPSPRRKGVRGDPAVRRHSATSSPLKAITTSGSIPSLGVTSSCCPSPTNSLSRLFCSMKAHK